MRHMPRSSTLTLIVLTGHLLIEEELNKCLAAKLREPTALFDARLNFSQRLALFHALLGSEKDYPFPYSSLEKLNALRNQLAHNLEPKDLENRIKTFLEELEESGYDKEFGEEKLATRLRRCIALLCGVLSGFTKGCKAAKQSLE